MDNKLAMKNFNFSLFRLRPTDIWFIIALNFGKVLWNKRYIKSQSKHPPLYMYIKFLLNLHNSPLQGFISEYTLCSVGGVGAETY